MVRAAPGALARAWPWYDPGTMSSRAGTAVSATGTLDQEAVRALPTPESVDPTRFDLDDVRTRIRRDGYAIVHDLIAPHQRGEYGELGASEIELRSVDREGNSQKLRMKLFWKPAKDGAAPRTVLRVVEPTEFAGAAYLAISKPEGDEVYLYMPALGRAQSG